MRDNNAIRHTNLVCPGVDRTNRFPLSHAAKGNPVLTLFGQDLDFPDLGELRDPVFLLFQKSHNTSLSMQTLSLVAHAFSDYSTSSLDEERMGRSEQKGVEAYIKQEAREDKYSNKMGRGPFYCKTERR